MQSAFLAKLYELQFVKFEDALDYADWAQENGYQQRDVDHCFGLLREKGLVDAYALGSTAEITSNGILFVEDNELFDSEVISHQKQFRIKFLVALAEIRDEHGLNYSADWAGIVQQIGAAEVDFDTNYDVLKDSGFIDNHAARSFYITPQGYAAVEEYRKATKFQRELERLSNATDMTVTERETGLTALLEAKSLVDGWQCEMVALEEGANETPILYRDLNFFLSECFWSEGELLRADVRALREQVKSRPGTNGCIFSMSPVSVEAIGEAQVQLEKACIIIFGKDDLKELFYGGTLTDAINSKMVNARIRRSIQAK